MIVIKIELHSANTGRETDLGTMIIDNIGGTRTSGDYRCRMYKKGEVTRVNGAWRLFANSKPIREGFVFNHKRLQEPVQNLITKSLKEMGYG